MVNPLLDSRIKSIFLKGDRPYNDVGDLLQVARSIGSKVLGCEKVRVIEIVTLRNIPGYVAVVQASGGKSEVNG